MGLFANKYKPRSTNEGNTSRRLFESPCVAAEVTGTRLKLYLLCVICF